MRIAVASGLVVAAVAAAGVVLAQKGALPLPTTLTNAISPPTPAIAPPAPPAPVIRPANPVTNLTLQAPATTVAQGQGGSTTASVVAPAVPNAPAAAAPAPATPEPKCDNPNALGVARVVQIDTTGGPGFGFEHFKTHDFLRPMEVVLTFDDGPWPVNTPNVLAALAAECVKAIFFPIGQHATYHPEILKQVAAQGHTIGNHTWSHPKDISKLTLDQAKEEIEKGVSAVHWALGAPGAPFIRFPSLKHPPDVVAYVGERNMAIFSTDLDSFDFKIKKPDQVIKSVMTKLDKAGKGIVLMHDFQHATSLAVPELLKQLKAKGYKIVQVKAKGTLATIEAYDAEVMKDLGGPAMSGASARPTKDIVETISGE